MTANYRLVHFTPDPFTGTRFVLGALVVNDNGEVQPVQAERLPSADCLGDRALAIAVQRLHSRLATITSAERLPDAFGPYAWLAEPSPLPGGVRDPVDWVRSLLAPEVQRDAHLRTPRGPQRSTVGYRFFETWQVAQHVRKTFQPSSDWGAWLGRHAAGLQGITHWVQGDETVLLMEPVVPTRRQFDADLREVAARFGSYRYAMENTKNGRSGDLVAYITAGGAPEQRAEAREALAPFAHLVVDTTNAEARGGFLGKIRGLVGGDKQESLAGEA